MKLKSFTLPALTAFLCYCSTSCNNPTIAVDAVAIQIPAGQSQLPDTVVYESPMRMFTEDGEITDPAAIAAYRRAHGIHGDAAPVMSLQGEHVLSSRTERVVYNGSSAKDVVIMRQQDTGTVGMGSRQGSVDGLFAAERAFLALRDEILDIRSGVTQLERIDDQNYCVRECYHVRGESDGESLRVPYTFVATRNQLGNYPYALKSGIVPKVASGDTVLVREGFIALR